MPTGSPNSLLRLRKHADYQRVYAASKKQFSKQMTFFFSLRPEDRRSDTPGPRIGLTVGKVMGKAVDRNRMKRRMRECIRHNAAILQGPVDVILHPRRTILEMEFAKLEREVAQVFRTVQATLDKQAISTRRQVENLSSFAEGGGPASPQASPEPVAPSSAELHRA